MKTEYRIEVVDGEPVMYIIEKSSKQSLKDFANALRTKLKSKS